MLLEPRFLYLGWKTSDDGRKDGTRRVVTGEPDLAHPRPVVNHQRRDLVVHGASCSDDVLLLILQPKMTTQRVTNVVNTFRFFFISRVLSSPPSPTSELRDRQLCGVVVNRLQIVIMDTSRLYGPWSASVRSYRILMWTGPTGANLHDRCHDLSESGSA